MILGMTAAQLLWFFIIYSFLGWTVEVSYHAVTLGKVVNRGFLNGPVCPVYGCGVVVVFAVLEIVGRAFGIDTNIETANVLVLFVIGLVFATLIELIAGFLLDKLFHARWWDYSDRKFNLNGYICLGFSIIWGLAIAFVLRVIQPGIERLVDSIPKTLSLILLICIYVGFTADIVITVLTVLKFNKELEKMQAMQQSILRLSDGMSEAIGNGTIKVVNRIETELDEAAVVREEIKETVEAKKEEHQAKKAELLEKLEQKKAEFERSHLFGTGRLLRAFPYMKHRKYQDVLDMLRREEKRLKEKHSA